MRWQPVTEEKLAEIIELSLSHMDQQQLRLWQALRIPLEKWQLPGWGDEGGGFWVLGLPGRTAIWFSDVEDGFNCSSYTCYGTLDEYTCDQDEPNWVIYRLCERLKHGELHHQRLGPPQAIV